MDYLNSDSDVDIEPPCGPGELIFIVSFVPVSPCAVCHRHLSDRFALYLKKGERKRSELKGKIVDIVSVDVARQMILGIRSYSV